MRGADGGESSGLSTASPPCIIASALEGLDSSRLPWHMPGPTVLVLCIFGTLEPVVGFVFPRGPVPCASAPTRPPGGSTV